MKIRKAVLSDSSGIARVQVDSWRKTYKGIVPDEYLNNMSYDKREEVWKGAVTQSCVLVAENAEEEIVGFILAGRKGPETFLDTMENFMLFIFCKNSRKRESVKSW